MARDTGDFKQLAAEKAAMFLDGVRVLGLGSGSTAAAFVRVVAEMRDAGGLAEIVAVPTSAATATLARQRGIPLVDLDAYPRVDLTVDGADEVGPSLDLIKGLGGALTREKVVASASRELIIVADDSKLVTTLGEQAPLPVEVLQFGWVCVANRLKELGAVPERRTIDGYPFVTDEDNYIIDCRFPAGLGNPRELGRCIDSLPGVVAHGLFLEMAERVVIAGSGGVRILERS